MATATFDIRSGKCYRITYKPRVNCHTPTTVVVTIGNCAGRSHSGAWVWEATPVGAQSNPYNVLIIPEDRIISADLLAVFPRRAVIG